SFFEIGVFVAGGCCDVKNEITTIAKATKTAIINLLLGNLDVFLVFIIFHYTRYGCLLRECFMGIKNFLAIDIYYSRII
ncbi:MAG: hypothetical protein KAI72_05175, partial [Candidatus Pacebacteria bacterium]|nr:hypothetical protein [Candidatus Paceibacterota bacterium]